MFEVLGIPEGTEMPTRAVLGRTDRSEPRCLLHARAALDHESLQLLRPA